MITAVVLLTILSISSFAATGMENDSLSISTENEMIEYPTIDLSAGFGIRWFLQANATISPYKHIYFQPRLSYSVTANEAGFVVGFQNRLGNDSIIRLGIGVSKGKVTPIWTSSDKDDQWKTLYVRIGIFKDMGSYFVNPNVNVIHGDNRTIFSLNITFAFIII